jgi:hypothetical protein
MSLNALYLHPTYYFLTVVFDGCALDSETVSDH